jgi:hypothetical protein
VRRLLLLMAVAAAALAVGPAPAGATNECDGLLVCVPVAGPWVVVPLGVTVRPPRVEYQLSCPRGYVVGGLDAELSDRPIDIGFVGTLGSPVNPGITTGRRVVFVGTYVGTTARAPSFRPHIGCMPSAGGGGRVPTSTAAVVPPGQPAVRRVRTTRVRPGTRIAAQSCARGERLVSASHAFGFFTAEPPTASLVATVTGRATLAGRQLAVSVRADAELAGARAVVQVHVVCTRAR